MKYFQFLDTDFYQIAMSFMYVYTNNNNKCGFEGFARHIKEPVNQNKDFYIFDGETEVHNYIENIRKELKDPQLIETIIEIIEPKIKVVNKSEVIEQFRQNWKNIDFDFEYNVVKNGTKVFPYIPVFQFSGNIMIGQMIETYVTNIYNGKTGIKTIEYLKNDNRYSINDADFKYIYGVVHDEFNAMNIYKNKLIEKAKEFRNSTNSILLEAGFRRAPSKIAANLASRIAIENGWNGTSNVGVGMTLDVSFNYINGTMAHAFVMSFETEKEAFETWNQVFPNTTFLIDTYNVYNAMNIIKDMQFNDVRIDSDPIEEYVVALKKEFPNKGIFVSGDMTPERLIELDKLGITKSMAGTKYVYPDEIIEKVNCGFVYKLVQFTKDGKTFYPEKTSNGKKSFSGLKKVVFNEKDNSIIVTSKNNEFGFFNLENSNENTKVIFDM